MTREEEVIKWLESLKAEIGKSEHRTLWHYAEAIDMAIEALKGRPKGHWRTMYDGDPITGEPYPCGVYCDQCGDTIGVEANYCPNCGADMRGEDDGQEA